MKNVKILAGILSLTSNVIFANVDGVSTDSEIIEENDIVLEYFNTELEKSDNSEARDGRVAQSTDGEKPTTDGTVASPSEPPASTDAEPAKPKKIVKKKLKKKAVAEGEITVGLTTGHGAQESGLPYNANVDLSFEYSSESKTKKFKDSSYKDSESTIKLDVTYLFVFGRMEIGPKFSFLSSTTKSDTAIQSTGTKVSSTLKTSGLGLGAGFAFNLGNIHQNKTVPYIGADFQSVTTSGSSSLEGSSDTSKETNKEINLGLEGGLKYFMGGHIALKPFLNYTMTVSGENKLESTGSDALVASVSGSHISLGLGIAKYF